MNDPDAMLAVLQAMRQAHGDEVARSMLADGMSLASLFKTLLAASIPNRQAVRLVSRSFADFAVTPDVGQAWHIKRVYSRPGSFDVIDVVLAIPDGTIGSDQITLRLPV